MHWLDMRTVAIGHLATAALCAAAFGALWWQYRRRYAGLSLWLADYVLQLLGALLIALRGQIPDFVSMVASNTAILGGAWLGLMGLERFLGRRGPHGHNVVYLAVFAAIHSWFALAQPSLLARNVNISAGLLLMSGQCAWLLLWRVPPGQRGLTRGVGLIFVAFAAISACRIVLLALQPPASEDYFRSGATETLIMMVYPMAYTALTIGMIMMITGRLQTELQAQEEKFARAFHSAPYAITLTRFGNGVILEVNEHFYRLSGFQRAEVIGKSTVELNLWADPKAREAVLAELRQGSPIRGRELAFRRKNGEIFWCQCSADLVTIQGEPWILTSIEDLTERKQLERQRTQLEAQMRHQQKLESIGTLAAGVAHEINNPINGVMNYAQIILDEAGGDAQRAEYAREIIHETERVAAIVRNLLQFARQEIQAHSPADLRDIVEATLSLVRTVIKKDQITLQVELPAELPTLLCRSQQLQQVLMNLFTNARDALNQKHPGYHADKLIRVGAAMFEQAGRPWVRVTVEDHGGGIPAEVRDRVFDPFFSTKSRHEGTGLGLSISHGIVQEHGGRLWFETEPGQWTKFHVELPVTTEEPG